MAKAKGLEVDRRVGIALSVLPSLQKQAVERLIRTPQSFAAAARQPGRVRPIAASGQPLYKMRVTPSLWLIYTTVGETVHVLDVVERATLKFFAAQKVPATKPAGEPAKRAAKKPSNVLK
ncbi:MAG: hypothetical protein U0835_12875 [Isosphaeraceae bacterium]